MFKKAYILIFTSSLIICNPAFSDWFDDDTNIYHNSALNQINQGGSINNGDMIGPTMPGTGTSGGAGGTGGTGTNNGTITGTDPLTGGGIVNSNGTGGGGGGGGAGGSALSNIQGSGNGLGGGGGNSAITQNETTIIKRPLPPAPPLITNQIVPYGSDGFNIGLTRVFGGGQIGFTKFNESSKAINFATAAKIRAEKDLLYATQIIHLQDCDTDECLEIRDILLGKLKGAK